MYNYVLRREKEYMLCEHKSNIDILKAIAIFFVLITHFDWSVEQRQFIIFPFLINMAIPIFMIITGYVYSYSMKERLITNIGDAYKLPLISKRISRYSLPLVPIIIWELLNTRYATPSHPLEIFRWILVGTVGDGSYYYPVIMQLIFVFPVIYFMIERYKQKGLWICLIVNIVYEILTWAYEMNIECYRLLMFRYIFLIAVGVYAFHGYKINMIISILLMLIGTAFIIAITYMDYETHILNKYWATTNFLASMIIVPFIVWVLERKKQIHIFPLEVIGRASYHIFLVQMVYYLGYYNILINQFTKLSQQLLIGIVICVICGVLFYSFEIKLRDFMRKFFTSHMRVY